VDVGRQENLPVVDVWNAVYDAAGRNERALDRFLEDGLHLNAAGYDIMYDTLIDAIGNHYPEVHYDNLKSIFTPWTEINWDDRRAESLIAKESKI